jgi:hypothetical protein
VFNSPGSIASTVARSPWLAAGLALLLPICVSAGARATGRPAPAHAAVPHPPAATRAGAPCAVAHKPQPPLDLKLEALDPLAPGAAVRFRMTAVPRVPTEEVRLYAEPAPAVQWLAGERNARRMAGLGQPVELAFSLRVPTGGRYALHVVAEITGPDGTVWRRGAGLGLGPNPRADRARVVADGRGGRTLVYEAAPADRIVGGSR